MFDLTPHIEKLHQKMQNDESNYAKAKLKDSRVEMFLHFSLYAEVTIDYTRAGFMRGGKRVRYGASGTRNATRDLNRIPANKHPKGPPRSTAVIVRYYDLSRTRKDWRSFRRVNFGSMNSVKDDSTGRFTTNFADVVNSGQVPPPPLTLKRSEKRKLAKIISNGNNWNYYCNRFKR